MANPNAAPVEAPRQITPEPPPRPLSSQVGSGVAGGVMGGSASLLSAPPPPPPSAPVRVGGDIKEPKKIVNKDPVYPPVAMAEKIEGIVIIEATIAKDGSVKDAKILRGQPLLNQAATDAVTQWKFTPTTLNGEPVEVLMTVTVNFKLH